MLTNYNGTAITYDGIGNPLNWRNATSLTWQGRRLTAMVVNGTAMSFEYNSDGICKSKTYGNTTVNYITDGSKIIAEYSGNTYTYYIYDESGTIMGMMYNNQLYTFRKNLQGDVTGIYTANGNLVVEYTYSHCGEVLSTTGTLASTIGTANPFRYRGYYYDTETGFYYLQSRYYDPVVGRFLNADVFVSTGQGILGNNMFAYCNNEPINRIYTNGKCCTFNDIKACLQGEKCCDDNHSTYDYLVVRALFNGFDDNNNGGFPYRDVSLEVGKELLKAADMARRLKIYANQMGAFRRGGAELGKYVVFYSLVNHKAMWDIKTPKSWMNTVGTPFPGYGVPVLFYGMVMTPEQLGNFAYGFLGSAYGISHQMLILGSYYAAGFPNEGPKLGNEATDIEYILLGYMFGYGLYGE